MEPLKRKQISLRGFFLLTVFSVFGGVVLLSGLTIWGCMAFRHWLLPDPEAVYLTMEETLPDGGTSTSSYLLEYGETTKQSQIIEEFYGGETDQHSGTEAYGGNIVRRIRAADIAYSVQKLERGYDTLTPKRKLAWRLSGAAQVLVPGILSVGGILFCGFYFYRKKLSLPLKLLSNATTQIAEQNLDFTLEYPKGDEMGELCRSFETMRRELAENNRAMWEMLEQRRMLQASIAHDLRNPIAIVEGYTEYLQMNLPTGKLSPDKAERVVRNLNTAAKRLERYTESVRQLNQLEDMELVRQEISSGELLRGICDDLKVMADKAGITLRVNDSLPEQTLWADTGIISRILENVFENAARFARNSVSVDFTLGEERMEILVRDDGEGFPEEMFEKEWKKRFPGTREEGHLGLGLAISRTLSKKHGGSLQLTNWESHGAEVKIILKV